MTEAEAKADKIVADAETAAQKIIADAEKQATEISKTVEAPAQDDAKVETDGKTPSQPAQQTTQPKTTIKSK